MKTAGKERESGRCGEVPCEGSFKPIAGSWGAALPECCGSGPRGAVAWKLVKSFRKPCRDMALEEAHPPLPPSADPVHLLELGNIQRPCSGISSAVAEDGLGNGVRVYGRGIGRVCGCLCRAFLGRSVRKPGARGKRLLVGGDPRRGAGSGFRAESRSGEPAFTDYQRGTRRAGYKLAPPGTVVAWHRLPGHRVPDRAFRLTSTRRRGRPQCLRYSSGRAGCLDSGGGPFFSGS